MQNDKTYRDIACDDYETAIILMNNGRLNPCARYFQQYVEKTMKQIIVDKGDPENQSDMKLLGTHNLVSLAKRVEELEGIRYTNDDYRYFRDLRGLYFTTSYPGDSYDEIDTETAEDIAKWCLRFRELHEK